MSRSAPAPDRSPARASDEDAPPRRPSIPTGLDADFVREATEGVWLRRPESRAPGAPCEFSGVGTDTRERLDGMLFVALRGERHDGHEHLAAAAQVGAAAAIVDRDVDLAALPARFGILRVNAAGETAPGRSGTVCRETADAPSVGTSHVSPSEAGTLGALQRLAAAHRRRLRAVVIGITGSAGKTTTRRLLDAVLATRLRGVQSPKSFNNHIGVPLTLLSATPSHDYVLAEIGMSAPGEIAALSRLAEPEIGIVTGVGRAHLGGLGSVEAIAREKASLLEHLRWRDSTGAAAGSADACGDARIEPVAIACADAPALRGHLAALRRQGRRVITFGESADADVRLTGRRVASRSRGIGQEIEVDGSMRAFLALPGRHNAVNALAAIVAARAMGLDDAAIVDGLGRADAAEMRFERRTVGDGDGAVVLVNDAYNANPESMAAALATFAEIAAGAARRVVVLGDMLELGVEAPALHAELGERVVEVDRRASIDLAIFVGPMSAHAADAVRRAWPASDSTRVVAQPALDVAAIAALVRPGDAVLLKASRGMGLERAAAAIADAAGR